VLSIVVIVTLVLLISVRRGSLTKLFTKSARVWLSGGSDPA